MKVLVIGASTNPSRYSFIAINDLLKHNHEVFALGRKEGEVSGVSIFTEQRVLNEIDTVTLYINPTHQEGYADYIIGLKPRRVIFNPGTENKTFQEQLEAVGIETEVACTLVLLRINQF